METPLSAKAALLQALTVPGYGIELIDRVRRGSEGLVRLRLGSVYPALRALERQGLVRVRPVDHDGHLAGRPRRHYELTLAGVEAATAQREALLKLLGSPEETSTRPDPGEMRRRLEACSSLSASVIELRRRTRAVNRSNS